MSANNVFGGMTLKALLENPDLQHAPAALSSGSSNKGKKLGYGSGEADFTSAFLGPQLWEKPFTTTTDGSNFSLEYMDLDEFLSENGLPIMETPGLDELVLSPNPALDATAAAASQGSPGIIQQPSPCPVVTQPVLSASPPMGLPPTPPAHMTASPASSLGVMSPEHFLSPAQEEVTVQSTVDTRAMSPTSSTPPVSPIPVQVNFKLSEQDLVLSSIPGQELFDPTTSNFSEDDLKPQPMIKKSRKVFVPDEMKDDRYWARRKKNNTAAKRSRNARRVKENQIAMRAAYLEKENSTLRDELEKLKRDNCKLKHRLSKYESVSSNSSS